MFDQFKWRKHIGLDRTLSQEAKMVGWYLLLYADGRTGEHAHPGLENIYRDCRMAERRAVRALDELEARNLIVKTFDGRGSGNKLADEYKLLMPEMPTASPAAEDEPTFQTVGTSNLTTIDISKNNSDVPTKRKVASPALPAAAFGSGDVPTYQTEGCPVGEAEEPTIQTVGSSDERVREAIKQAIARADSPAALNAIYKAAQQAYSGVWDSELTRLGNERKRSLREAAEPVSEPASAPAACEACGHEDGRHTSFCPVRRAKIKQRALALAAARSEDEF